jgi:hypothetical protein
VRLAGLLLLSLTTSAVLALTRTVTSRAGCGGSLYRRPGKGLRNPYCTAPLPNGRLSGPPLISTLPVPLPVPGGSLITPLPVCGPGVGGIAPCGPARYSSIHERHTLRPASRLGQDVELRRSENGKDWVRLSVGVGEGDEVTWVSVAIFEEKARALAGLAEGAEVYVEGRLSLSTWTGRDGTQRTGLSVSAWQVLPLARSDGGSPRTITR